MVQAEVQRQLGPLLEHIQLLEQQNVQLQQQLQPTNTPQLQAAAAESHGAGRHQPMHAAAGADDLLRQRPQAAIRGVGPLPVVDERGDVAGDRESSSLPGGNRASTQPDGAGHGSGSMFQAFLAGLRGQRERSPSPEVIEATGRSTTSAPVDGGRTSLPRASTNEASGPSVLDALAKGVQQLQELQAQALQKGEASPEAIRQTIPPFPVLKEPSGDQSGLQLQIGWIW